MNGPQSLTATPARGGDLVFATGGEHPTTNIEPRTSNEGPLGGMGEGLLAGSGAFDLTEK